MSKDIKIALRKSIVSDFLLIILHLAFASVGFIGYFLVDMNRFFCMFIFVLNIIPVGMRLYELYKYFYFIRHYKEILASIEEENNLESDM